MHLHRGNLFLVGMPGSGKSTLGRLLAKRLDKHFYDTDAELERRLGVTIPVIFELEGEPGFRERESTIICRIRRATRTSSWPPAAARSCARPIGPRSSRTAPCCICTRRRRRSGSGLAAASTARLLQAADPHARLNELYAFRDPLYREVADFVVESDSEQVIKLAQRLEQQLRSAARA